MHGIPKERLFYGSFSIVVFRFIILAYLTLALRFAVQHLHLRNSFFYNFTLLFRQTD